MNGGNKIFAAIAVMLMLLGCSKTHEHGAISVKLNASNPAEYMKVNVEILGVDVRFASDEEANRAWVTLETRPGIYDLVTLENDLGIVLAEKSTVMGPESIAQIRLRLGIKNSVTVSGNIYPMQLPDDLNRTVLIDLKTEVKPGYRTEITLNADIARSVKLHDNGSFSFHPAIRVKQVNWIKL